MTENRAEQLEFWKGAASVAPIEFFVEKIELKLAQIRARRSWNKLWFYGTSFERARLLAAPLQDMDARVLRAVWRAEARFSNSNLTVRLKPHPFKTDVLEVSSLIVCEHDLVVSGHNQ